MISFKMTEEQELARDAMHDFAAEAIRPIGRECDEASSVPAEFLDQVESRLKAAGAVTFRISKEIFSKPAAPAVIDEIAARSDLVVEALAD